MRAAAGKLTGRCGLRNQAALATVAAMRYLLVVAVLASGCSGAAQLPPVPVGQEIEPAPGAEVGAAVPRRAEIPVSPAAPSKPPLPKTSAIKTDAPTDVAAAPADAVRLPSGLAYKTLRPGDGPLATGESTVSVHYAGWTTDGNLFDSSILRSQPLTIGLHQVIEGWRIGVGTMKVGEIRRMWIPQELAYKGKAGAPAGTLVFDVELLQVE